MYLSLLVGILCWSFWYSLICVLSNFSIILARKIELVAILLLSFMCRVVVLWLFLMVQGVGIQCVIVVFPDHTHLLFNCYYNRQIYSGFCY